MLRNVLEVAKFELNFEFAIVVTMSARSFALSFVRHAVGLLYFVAGLRNPLGARALQRGLLRTRVVSLVSLTYMTMALKRCG